MQGAGHAPKVLLPTATAAAAAAAAVLRKGLLENLPPTIGSMVVLLVCSLRIQYFLLLRWYMYE